MLAEDITTAIKAPLRRQRRQPREHRGPKSADATSNKLVKSPIVVNLAIDIHALLYRFLSRNVPSELSFQSFKDEWKDDACHFSLIHHTFDPAKVDYNRMIQSGFHIALQQFFVVPDVIRSIPQMLLIGSVLVKFYFLVKLSLTIYILLFQITI